MTSTSFRGISVIKQGLDLHSLQSPLSPKLSLTATAFKWELPIPHPLFHIIVKTYQKINACNQNIPTDKISVIGRTVEFFYHPKLSFSLKLNYLLEVTPWGLGALWSDFRFKAAQKRAELCLARSSQDTIFTVLFSVHPHWLLLIFHFVLLI